MNALPEQHIPSARSHHVSRSLCEKNLIRNVSHKVRLNNIESRWNLKLVMVEVLE